MCYIKGTGAGRIGGFKLLKGNKVTMTLKDTVTGTFAREHLGKKKKSAGVSHSIA